MASVYALRMFIRAFHNRVGRGVDSREMTIRDGLVLVPLVAAILAFALYPQVALKKSEPSVTGSIRAAQQAAQGQDQAEVRP
jgi:NADH-quinone oxidoreductase subunit M